MVPAAVKTSFDRLTPLQARSVLAIAVLAAMLLVGVTLSPLRSGYADAPDRGPGDVELYNAEVQRIQAGQSYYDAAAAELRQRGYPTRSVFNWRMPLPVWLIGVLPDPAIGKALLGVAALALSLLAFGWMHDECGMRAALGCTLLLSGALLPCFLGDLFVMPELWSGVFIALSAAAYGRECRKLAVVAGLTALLLRELAAPYCVLCIALALYERRPRELAGWFIGLTLYFAYFGLHVSHVLPRIGPADVAHANSWICFGGAAFVISTVQMNAYLLLLPQWVAAVYLAGAMLGAASWRSPGGQRIGLTLALYVIALGIIGQPFNQYWGSMTAPLFCFGAARLPATLSVLLRRAFPHPAVVATA